MLTVDDLHARWRGRGILPSMLMVVWFDASTLDSLASDLDAACLYHHFTKAIVESTDPIEPRLAVLYGRVCKRVGRITR